MPVFTIDTLRTAIGEAEFMRLADRDRDRVLGTEDIDAVERAILAGQGDIDSRIKGKFKTPIADPPPELREAYLDAIVYRMHPRGQPIPEDTCKRYELAIKWAKDVKGDEAQLTSEAQPELRRTPAATATGSGRKFTTTKLRDVL
jgi:phage gp36-like protein